MRKHMLRWISFKEIQVQERFSCWSQRKSCHPIRNLRSRTSWNWIHSLWRLLQLQIRNLSLRFWSPTRRSCRQNYWLGSSRQRWLLDCCQLMGNLMGNGRILQHPNGRLRYWQVYLWLHPRRMSLHT
jgi:hypothetical protein